MVLKITYTDSDEAQSTEIIKNNDIKIIINLLLVRDALVVKIPDENKMSAQFTTKVNIHVILTGRNLKVVTKADGHAMSEVELTGPAQKLQVYYAPPGTGYDPNDYARILTESLGRKVLTAAMRQQTAGDRSELSKTLDNMGEVAKIFALTMSDMIMKVKGPKQYMVAEHSKMSCETVLTVNKWLPLAPFISTRSPVYGASSQRPGVKVTDL